MSASSAFDTKMESRRQYQQIAKTLRSIITAENISQNQMAKLLNVNQGTLSKFLAEDMSAVIPLCAIVELCRLYDISLTDLVSTGFTYRTLEDRKKEELDVSGLSLLKATDLKKNFIVDPTSNAFAGYKQTYHCYFLPTRTGQDELLLGRLQLSEDNGVCRARFDLYRDRNAPMGAIPDKSYSGFAVISATLHTMYVILYSTTIGELSVLNFSHFNLNLQPLDCRLAEVLTNSAGASHVPTVHRMLVSREPIREEHLSIVKPHLLLNSETIMISEQELAQISCSNDKLIKHLTGLLEPRSYYTFTESYVRHNAQQVLSNEEVQLLLSDFRSRSISDSCNKAGTEADANLHSLLTQYGYYQNKTGRNGTEAE